LREDRLLVALGIGSTSLPGVRPVEVGSTHFGWPLHFNRTELINEMKTASAALFVCCLFSRAALHFLLAIRYEAYPHPQNCQRQRAEWCSRHFVENSSICIFLFRYDGADRGDETMKTILIAVAIAGVSLPALGQTKDTSRDLALADCLQAADQKYKDTWKGLCGQDGKGFRYCNEFIGSPRDKEFSQLRIEEMTLCSKLYGR
jgi:hypothetical protein